MENTINVTSTQVLCKDGSYGIDISSVNAKYDNSKTCINNGGRAENQNINMVKTKAPTQATTSDFEYYTSSNFLRRASIVIVPVGLIGYYCYNKKFSLLKSALLLSIPIVAITGLQYIGMGGGKNKFWGIFVPPSIRANQLKKIQLIEQQTGIPQKIK